MGVFELANRLAVRAVGRSPDWKLVDRSDLVGTPVPEDDGYGVHLEDANVALLHVQTREVARYRTTYPFVHTVDDTADYTATLDGTSSTYSAVGGDGQGDIAQGLATAVDGTAVNNGTVTASPVDRNDDGTDDAVVIKGDQWQDYNLTVSTTNNGILVPLGDPLTYDFRVWLLPRDPRDQIPEAWVQANQGQVSGVDWRGYTERLDIAGYRRLHVEVTDQSGVNDQVPARPYIYVGPGVEEINE